MRVGTPPILQLAVLEEALKVWDGVDMATFEGNRDLFNYGAPQDYVTFSAVASSDSTRLEFRSDVFRKEDGGGIVTVIMPPEPAKA